MEVGTLVRTKIELISDFSNEGMGSICLAYAKDLLIIQGKSPYFTDQNVYYCTTLRDRDYKFTVWEHELEQQLELNLCRNN